MLWQAHHKASDFGQIPFPMNEGLLTFWKNKPGDQFLSENLYFRSYQMAYNENVMQN